MIGELKNRLTHLFAVKTDAEIQGDFIKFLKKEVEIAAFTGIEDFPFVKWLDDELSYLVDERVLLINTLVGRSRMQMHHARLPSATDISRKARIGSLVVFRDYPRQPCKSQNLYKTHSSTISLARPIKLWSEAVIKEILFINGNRVYTPRV
ncbi:PROTEIN CHUP1 CHLOROPLASTIC-LIKE [Salix viminalis]|nr:PROTEIN CHUP1 CHLOROPLASTIC-LIKE [Salix viminalis]